MPPIRELDPQRPGFALISDVDGTLLGDDAALKEFAGWLRERRETIRLAYNSGRFVSSVRESVATTPLPEPDAIIGGVGTQICDFRTGRPIDGWPPADENWDAKRIAARLSSFAELEPQPAEFQSDFKLSYFARRASPAFLDEVRAALRTDGIACELIYSSNRDLDLLPAGVNKGTASAFLARRWNVPSHRVCVSGDSGNDLTLFQHDFRGIVVQNAHTELKALDDPLVFHSSHPYAAGVHDGLQHWLSAGS